MPGMCQAQWIGESIELVVDLPNPDPLLPLFHCIKPDASPLYENLTMV